MLGDAALLQQALANLLDNALKFSPPGSRVRLCGDRQDGRVRLTVSDEGPGIPEEDRARAAIASSAARRPGIRPASGLASPSPKRSPGCTAARCCWRTPGQG